MTLNQLTENQSGIIKQINDESLAIQMLAMGFILGEEIKIERIAPLGDPILITISDGNLALRKDEAQYINIVLIP